MPRKSKRRTRKRTRRKRGGLPCLAWHPKREKEYNDCIAKRKGRALRIKERGFDPQGKHAKAFKKECDSGTHLDWVYGKDDNGNPNLSHKDPHGNYIAALDKCGPWLAGEIGCRPEPGKRQRGHGCYIEAGKEGEIRKVPIIDLHNLIDEAHIHTHGVHSTDVSTLLDQYKSLNTKKQKGGRWPSRSSGPTNKKGSRKKTKKKRTKNKTKKKRRKKRRRKRRR